jgi:predicted RNA binding protein with dsRBD fold (UPF0201 family)
MVVLTNEEIDQAEDAILAVLEDEDEPLSPERLIELLRERQIADFPSRAAMWSLIADHRIDFTIAQMLQLPQVDISNGTEPNHRVR